MDDFTETIKDELKQEVKKQFQSKDTALMTNRILVMLLRYFACIMIIAGIVVFTVIIYFRSGGNMQQFIANIITILPLVLPVLVGIVILFIARKINNKKK